MASFWGDGFMDEDEDNNDLTTDKKPWDVGKDGLILLIDSTKPMFATYDGSELSPFQKCMKCAKSVLMNKIISSEKDLIGIVLFGTEKHQNSSDFKNVYCLQELDMPDANRILEIESLERTDKFEDLYGHCDSVVLSDALWECSNVFANTPFKLAHKRILLFTSNDDPHFDNKELKKRALRKSKDLQEIDIELELLPLLNSFDASKFYSDMINQNDLLSLANPSEKIDELLTRVRMKEFKKRATTRALFNLKDDLSFSVSIYSLNKAATKGSYVHVDSRTNEEVKCSTRYICCDTGQELLPTDIKMYQEFGGSKIIFEKEEVTQMKNLVKPGFHLLGFKPKKYLKKYYHLKECSFMYPDEGSVCGSTNLFACLLESCLSKNVTPICIYKNTAFPPRMVALLPQEEKVDENKIQINPSGFYVVYLPYSDDIRKLKIGSHPKASDEQVDKAKEIVEKLKFSYSVDMFENPAVQKFYRGLEAFALDRDDIEEYKDLTLPDFGRIDEKIGPVIKEFNDLVFPIGYNFEGASKRKPSSLASGATKKPKLDSVDVNVQEVAQRGNLSKLTVSVMKTFCQANKIKCSSQKKADLISAINNHFQL